MGLFLNIPQVYELEALRGFPKTQVEVQKGPPQPSREVLREGSSPVELASDSAESSLNSLKLHKCPIRFNINRNTDNE